MIFFSARQTYSGFFHKSSNQKQTQPDGVTCEKRFWRRVLQTITNCPHEAFMSLPKAHLSEKAVGINLCCVTDKDKKNGQVLLGKENKLVKEQRWKKHFGHATWKKGRAWWKEKEQQERQYLNHQSWKKKIKCTGSLEFSTILNVVLFQFQRKRIVQNFPSTVSMKERNRLWNPWRTGSCWCQQCPLPPPKPGSRRSHQGEGSSSHGCKTKLSSSRVSPKPSGFLCKTRLRHEKWSLNRKKKKVIKYFWSHKTGIFFQKT